MLGAHKASGMAFTCSEESHSDPESYKLSGFVTSHARQRLDMQNLDPMTAPEGHHAPGPIDNGNLETHKVPRCSTSRVLHRVRDTEPTTPKSSNSSHRLHCVDDYTSDVRTCLIPCARSNLPDVDRINQTLDTLSPTLPGNSNSAITKPLDDSPWSLGGFTDTVPPVQSGPETHKVSVDAQVRPTSRLPRPNAQQRPNGDSPWSLRNLYEGGSPMHQDTTPVLGDTKTLPTVLGEALSEETSAMRK